MNFSPCQTLCQTLERVDGRGKILPAWGFSSSGKTEYKAYTDDVLLSPVGAVKKSGQGAGAEAGLHLSVQVQVQITTQGPEAVIMWAYRPLGTRGGS